MGRPTPVEHALRTGLSLGEAGEILDQAGENCHLEYWYPDEKGLMKKLDGRLLGQKKGS